MSTKDINTCGLQRLRSEAAKAGVRVYRLGDQWMIQSLLRDAVTQCYHVRPAHYLDDERAALVRALGSQK